MFSIQVNVKNICRCCHSNGCFKNITTEYYHSGCTEVYENMLKETFNINILHSNSCAEISRLICESCIHNLRAALAFKNMVIASEIRLASFLEKLQNGDERDPENVNIEEALIKSEMCENEYDNNDFMETEQNDCLDDGVLSIKDEIETQEKVNETCGVKKKRNLEESINKSKRKKVDCDNDNKNWTKIAERRGLGPILRENSLKLLSNSTMHMKRTHETSN
ncbi:unnamed protein product [Euphydryas editha]|uniref:ZAD domain-containing protein n=1 Tax=Euphydryas editha TaxID=104508 RepID=A0AAU9UNG1_EUPED|nr:unnamed protein product [Euphydryas editha]